MTDTLLTPILPAEPPKQVLEAAKRLFAYFRFLSTNYELESICALELLKLIGVPESEHYYPAAEVSSAISRLTVSDPVRELEAFIGRYPDMVKITNLIRSYTNGGKQFFYHEVYTDLDTIGSAWRYKLNQFVNGLQ